MNSCILFELLILKDFFLHLRLYFNFKTFQKILLQLLLAYNLFYTRVCYVFAAQPFIVTIKLNARERNAKNLNFSTFY